MIPRIFDYFPIHWEDKRRQIILWSEQACPCLSLLSFSQPYNSLSALTGFQEYASSSPNLTPIIASVMFSNRLRMDTSPSVSGTLHLWRTSSSGMMRLWWIRFFLCTQLGNKYFFMRCMILSCISLWCVMTSPPLGQLSTLRTEKVCMHLLLFFWILGGIIL